MVEAWTPERTVIVGGLIDDCQIKSRNHLMKFQKPGELPIKEGRWKIIVLSVSQRKVICLGVTLN